MLTQMEELVNYRLGDFSRVQEAQLVDQCLMCWTVANKRFSRDSENTASENRQ